MHAISREREAPATAQISQKEILLTGITAIVDSVLLAIQRKPWFD